MRETFAIWTGDWVASPHDDLVLMPMAENEVYQKAFDAERQILQADGSQGWQDGREKQKK